METKDIEKELSFSARLRYALFCAQEDAEAVTTNDYGTFNFDTPIILLPKGTDVSEFQTKECRELFGFSLEKVDWGCYQGWYFINGVCDGMQMRRTKMAEAVAESLKRSGFTASVYYQMD